jgi:hypothetical protein
VFATDRVCCGSCLAAGGAADGLSVGNRPAALPPGLSTGLALGRYGRLPTASGDTSVVACAVGSAGLVVAELAAVTDVVADTCGSLVRPVVLATAVKRTEVTVVAEAATAIFACSWRLAEFASSAPRSHDALPSWLPQPKLNAGFRLAGAEIRRTVAVGTLPPCAQAVTVHRAVCPRWMLVLAGCTATQRLTCAGWAVGLLVNATGLVLLAAGLGVVADGVGVADVVLEVLAGVGVELVDDLAVAVVVLGLTDVDAVEDAGELVLAVGDLEALAVGVAVLDVPAVGLLVDGCGLGEVLGVAVGVGVGVGEEVAGGNGWHCCTAPVAAATAAVSPAA